MVKKRIGNTKLRRIEEEERCCKHYEQFYSKQGFTSKHLKNILFGKRGKSAHQNKQHFAKEDKEQLKNATLKYTPSPF